MTALTITSPLSGDGQIEVFNPNGQTPDDIFIRTTVQAIADLNAGSGTEGNYVLYIGSNGEDTAGLAAAELEAFTHGKILRLRGLIQTAASVVFRCPVQFERGGLLQPFYASGSQTASDPVADAVVLTFNDQILAQPNQRIFNMREVRETVSVARVVIGLPQDVFPEWFDDGTQYPLTIGSTSYGGDWSKAWQQAADALRVGAKGGRVVGTEGKVYLCRWPMVFVGADYDIALNGSELLADMYRANRGYGNIVLIGNSTLGVCDLSKRDRINGNLNSNSEDNTFPDVPLPTTPVSDVYPAATHARINTKRINIYGGKVSYFDDVAQPGNYGVQFSNCAFCTAHDLTFRNTSQMFGFGSDVAPQNPYAHSCEMFNCVQYQSNQFHSYYILGFFGYCNNCHATNVRSFGPPGTTANEIDGNGASFNYAFFSSLDNFILIGSKGSAAHSAGIEMGFNARRCFATDGIVSGFKTAIEFFSFPTDPAGWQAGDENVIADIRCQSNSTLLKITGHHGTFSNISDGGTSVVPLDLASNVNATKHVFSNMPFAVPINSPFTLQEFRSLRSTDRSRLRPTFAKAANGTNIAKVTLTWKDGFDQTIPFPYVFPLWLSDNAEGEGLSAVAATVGITAATSGGTLFATNVAGKAITFQALKTGVAQINIADANKRAVYVCTQWGNDVYVFGPLSASDYG